VAISGAADMHAGFARSERAVEQRIGPDSRAHGGRGAPACRSILVFDGREVEGGMKTGGVLRTARGCGEAAAYVCGAVALVVVAGLIAFLLEFVTIGPLPLPFRGSSEGTAVYYALQAVGLDRWFPDGARPAGIVLVSSAGVLTWRVRRLRGSYAAATMMQCAVGLAVLGLSYRFPALLALVGVVAWRTLGHPKGLVPWIAWVLALAACFAPYDVTLRNFDGPGHLETAVDCMQKVHFDDYAANRKVCVGSDTDAYNTPTGVWVW
jgi:hypothetical protein